jgi:hypothetical protein
MILESGRLFPALTEGEMVTDALFGVVAISSHVRAEPVRRKHHQVPQSSVPTVSGPANAQTVNRLVTHSYNHRET